MRSLPETLKVPVTPVAVEISAALAGAPPHTTDATAETIPPSATVNVGRFQREQDAGAFWGAPGAQELMRRLAIRRPAVPSPINRHVAGSGTGGTASTTA